MVLGELRLENTLHEEDIDVEPVFALRHPVACRLLERGARGWLLADALGEARIGLDKLVCLEY